MKKIYLLALVALAVAACQKDTLGGSGTLRITAEGMHGAGKVAVSGTVSYWASDDQVLINGEQVTVNIDEPNNTVTVNSASSFEAPFFGVYPAGIYVSNSGADYTLNLPSSYTYATTTHYGRTLQNLPSPMVAYLATAGDNPVLEFKHVTGALNVMVINHYGFTIQVDSIVVSSNKYQLCGSKTVTLGNTITVNAVETNDAALRRVKMAGGTALCVLAGDTAIIQVPVLPVGADNRFTIEVGVHKVDQAAVKKVFSKTQGNAGSDYSLDRAQIGYVPTKFGGLFTINASGKKVIISQGNLQYNKTTNVWSFMTKQYGTVEKTAVGENYADSNIVSLFGWGTSGWNNGNLHYQPTKTECPSGFSANANGFGYGPYNGVTYGLDLTGEYANADWGVYNNIINGGNVAGKWRTPVNSEIGHILSSRNNISSVVNGKNNARYTYATVYDIHGIIVFPDDFVAPTFTQGSTWGAINTHSAWGTTINTTDWELLEAEGAVFLPAAGTRSANGNVSSYNTYAYYWSCRYYPYDNQSRYGYAYSMYFYSDNPCIIAQKRARYLGSAVRLVHDMN